MKSGQYIWRTKQDGEVRSHHASREGKVFSWNDPPPGGHPGEDYNYRCWAEEENCRDLWWEKREIVEKLTPLDARLSYLRTEIHNTKEEIKELEAQIELYENAKKAPEAVDYLGSLKNPLTTAAKILAKIALEKIDCVRKNRERYSRKAKRKASQKIILATFTRGFSGS